MLRNLAVTALLTTLVSAGTAAQNANTVISNASKAMGAERLSSVTYSGSASNANFGQSKSIAGPLAATTITSYTRAIDLAQPASRATGTTMPPAIPGGPPPQPGTFNQNITPANAAWTQQLEIWMTPWGFLKGAAANNATVRSQRIDGKTYNVVSWMTPQKAPSGQAYRLNGYINDQHMIERVETWVEHPILGDLHVDASYSNYQGMSSTRMRISIMAAGSRRLRLRASPSLRTRTTRPSSRRPSARRGHWWETASPKRTGNPGSSPPATGGCSGTTHTPSSCIMSRTSITPTAC